MSMGPQIFPASGEDVDLLARTVFGEASGETLVGQIAVAWTARHRAEIAALYQRAHGRWHPHFGDGSLARAVQAHDQYSCWNGGDRNYFRMRSVTLNDPAYQQAHYVAVGVIQGNLADALPATTHYYNPKIAIPPPAWSYPPAQCDGSIGNHAFFSKVLA